MIREWAEEVVENSKEVVGLGPYGLPVADNRNIGMWIVGQLCLRHDREVVLANKIYAAYGLDVDFTQQAKNANEYWLRNRSNNIHLNHPTEKTLSLLAPKIADKGLGVLLNCIPETVKEQL